MGALEVIVGLSFCLFERFPASGYKCLAPHKSVYEL